MNHDTYEMNLISAAIQKKISNLFDRAEKRLRKISLSYGTRKKVVQELAVGLELAGVKGDRIAIEIIKRLRQYVSPTLVRRTLPAKYKQLHRIENAKKRWTMRLATHVLLKADLREPKTPILTTILGKENLNRDLVKVSVPKDGIQWAINLSKNHIYIILDSELKFRSADCDLSDEELLKRTLEVA